MFPTFIFMLHWLHAISQSFSVCFTDFMLFLSPYILVTVMILYIYLHMGRTVSVASGHIWIQPIFLLHWLVYMLHWFYYISRSVYRLEPWYFPNTRRGTLSFYHHHPWMHLINIFASLTLWYASLTLWYFWVRAYGLGRVATVREKYLEYEFFSRSGKSQEILWIVREI